MIYIVKVYTDFTHLSINMFHCFPVSCLRKLNMEQAPLGGSEFHVPEGTLVGVGKLLGWDISQVNLVGYLKCQ